MSDNAVERSQIKNQLVVGPLSPITTFLPGDSFLDTSLDCDVLNTLR